jgi:hypothetical protein
MATNAPLKMKKIIANPTRRPRNASHAATHKGQPGIFIATKDAMNTPPAIQAHSINLLPALRLATRQKTQQ